MQEAFDKVKEGGPGTIGIIFIKYSNAAVGHVVTIANASGNVGIIEGQDTQSEPDEPYGFIDSVQQANERYNDDGRSKIGFSLIANIP